MLNYFNFMDFEDDVLITNDFGKHCFISRSDFDLLVHDQIKAGHPKYDELIDKSFIFDGHPEVFIFDNTTAMRAGKSYLFQSTSLFIFVVTNYCNAACLYCQAQDALSKRYGSMTTDTARKAVDIALSSPAYNMDFEFQGGEPLLNYNTIRFIVEYTEQQAPLKHKNVSFSLVSNLILLTDEMLAFFKEHNVSISTSLDGDACVHNTNRPLAGGGPTFDCVTAQFRRVRDFGVPIGAIETTTRFTLGKHKELIDTYISLNAMSVFIRPLTPLGFARGNWEKIGYTPEEFLQFYQDCLEYILQKNLEGVPIEESHAKLFLRKILLGEGVNYMELRSPCGAGIGQMAIYHDGRVFTCDEGRMLAEMGNDAFQLGTVEDTYDALVDNPVCKAACASSLLESMPKCCDCAYHPYCGTCPVVNFAMDGDIFANAPGNYRCKMYMGMLNVIFHILHKEDDSIKIFYKWLECD